MILDLDRFVRDGRPYWRELEATLSRLETGPGARLGLGEAQRLHYLYRRAAADLTRVATMAAAPEVRDHLERLVARAYGEIHEVRGRGRRLDLKRFFGRTLPRVFRRRARAFGLALAVTLGGSLFGAGALLLDPEAKGILMPFGHLMGDPSDRVAEEEEAVGDRLRGSKTAFSTYLMTHNTKVAITALALGMTWGLGTLIVLFFNGVILGAVIADYIAAGESVFLAGWLLPHGSIEIPAILIGGQAGLVLAGALLGWGDRTPLGARMRRVSPDVLTLVLGAAALLVWAGLIEAFLSQYHEPVLPYSAKIAFGVIELVLLALYLTRAGRAEAQAQEAGS